MGRVSCLLSFLEKPKIRSGTGHRFLILIESSLLRFYGRKSYR